MTNAFRSMTLLAAVFLAVTSLNAQSAPESIWGPVQYVSNADFQRMVQDGTVVEITPSLIFRQDVESRLQDLENRRAVYEYLRHHPDQAQLAALIAARPGRDLPSTADGDYIIQVPRADGTVATVETMSEAVKFENLASTINAAESQPRQLALYQSLYNGYRAFFANVCIGSGTPGAGGPPPECSNLPDPGQLTSPADLATAPISAIQRALQPLALNAATIVRLSPLESLTLSCSISIPGSSTVANSFHVGDMTFSYCKSPAPTGILANFNWLNKGLLSSVKNQGNRGLCHAFAATSAVEEVIARDTGCIVNLSEQDLLEHAKMVWDKAAPALFVDGGDPGGDLEAAAANNYHFAWENQWDYNPSYSRINPPSSGPPNPFAFAGSCTNYPYPTLEPGCSNTTPQPPVFCTTANNVTQCAFGLALLSGPTSPFVAGNVNSFWNPADTNLSFEYMLLNLAFNQAVTVAFNVTKDFVSPTAGYVTYAQDDLTTSVGGHAVHIVGYVPNSDLAANPGTSSVPEGAGGGYLIVKNSWGNCAGDMGYYYVPVAHFQAEIQAAYALTQELH